jgi:ribosomal protein L11 methyltransferase
MPRTWIEVRAAVAAEASEAAGEILRDLRGGGLVEEPLGTAPPRVRFRCYLPPSRLLRQTLAAVRARLRALPAYGLDPGRVTVTSRRVSARPWATAWRAHARPVRVGRLLIRPTWIRAAARPGDVVVAIDPGMAFGTGAHASTRLALRVLIGALRARPGAAVMDVGTGSGILAIAAARLGAGTVQAVDCDPIAVAAARANVRLNGCARRVRVAEGSGLGVLRGPAGVIVANIVADTIVGLLPDAAAHLEAGGVFIGSGIVAGRLGAVLRAARAAGLYRQEILRDGDWRAVVLSNARRRSGLRGSAGRRIQPQRRR